MKTFRQIALIAVIGVVYAIGSQVMAQGKQDFVLVNRTGVEIYALYVTPHNAKDWGEDILGADTLLNNEELEISFSRKERAKYWDLRIEDEDGNYIEWDRLNLLEISRVTLFYKNRKPTAIVE
ncbi:MAG: argininosuccinate lyase [Acidobacteria bacterium]|nr:argininosuccinate lyase [Acidobacteriota bacterium]